MMLSNRSVDYPPEKVLWALGSLCALHQLPFAAELVARELPSESANGIEPWVIIQAGERLGFKLKTVQVTPQRLAHLHLPLLIEIKDGECGAQALGLITATSQGRPTLESTAKKSLPRWVASPSAWAFSC